MDRILSGRKILITGGTGELGSAFVLKANESGAKVYFTYLRSRDKAKELELSGAKGFQLDLENKRSLDAFLTGFKKETGSLDVLIHNAVVVADGRIENLSEKDWDRVLAADLAAPFYLTRQLLPLLKEAEGAKVFFIVSQAGINGLWGAANYATAKGGLIEVTKQLALELGLEKTLVNAVNPGFMKSRLTEGLPPAVVRDALERSPLKKLSDPREVADFLVYLCSGFVKQITGQVFHFDPRPL